MVIKSRIFSTNFHNGTNETTEYNLPISQQQKRFSRIENFRIRKSATHTLQHNFRKTDTPNPNAENKNAPTNRSFHRITRFHFGHCHNTHSFPRRQKNQNRPQQKKKTTHSPYV